MLPRGEGDGGSTEYHLAEEHNMVEFMPDYSDDDEEDDQDNLAYRVTTKSATRSHSGFLTTMYRVGSLVDFSNGGSQITQSQQGQMKNPKLTEDLNRAKSDGVLFEQPESGVFYQGMENVL